MKIASVRAALPSRAITNEWVLRQIRDANAGRYAPAQLDQIEQTVDQFLGAAGTDLRYRLDDGERAIDVALRAGRDALARSGVAPDDVEFVLYAGVARGWIEPAMATVVQSELGLRNATGFDVLDACASWLRALEIAHAYISSGVYRVGLIVNCECGLYRSYARWALDDPSELGHQLASYTIGEAATATVLIDDGSARRYHFRFRTRAEDFRLCLLPTVALQDFWPGEGDPRIKPDRFFSLSSELLATATRFVLQEFAADPELSGRTFDVCFGHSPSEKVCRLIARKLGLEQIFVPTHREYGNTVSASIPLAMSLASDRGRLKDGDRVIVIVGSAGITAGFCAFDF